ncbi:phage antirepressor KilAC domain-containing protein [Nonomuraea sp. NPDC049714]|uniref:phage antirepressor KilAC domain-containing protein n=1 Tax=Nonomuraea sp. NPDC049714 TaxID=3364357 RepID=UPI00378D8821
MDYRIPFDDEADDQGRQLELSTASGPASPLDEIRHMDEDGEHWFARDLMPELDYGTDWRKFSDAIQRAMEACQKSGFEVAYHFVARDRMVPIGSGAFRAVADYRLTRYASFLVAQNGNPKRPAIARAQTYFAVQTYKQEIAEKQAATSATDLAVPDTTTPEGVLVVLDMLRDQVMARMQAERQVEQRDEKIKELTPGHELAETFAAANGTMTVRTFARNVQQWAHPRGIKVLQEHVFAYLGMIGMVIRAGTSEKGQATATALKAGWCENATTDYETHTRGTLLTTYARLTPKGVRHAWKRIHSTIGEYNTLDPKVIRP